MLTGTNIRLDANGIFVTIWITFCLTFPKLWIPGIVWLTATLFRSYAYTVKTTPLGTHGLTKSILFAIAGIALTSIRTNAPRVSSTCRPTSWMTIFQILIPFVAWLTGKPPGFSDVLFRNGNKYFNSFKNSLIKFMYVTSWSSAPLHN